jgi:hypothetical protein
VAACTVSCPLDNPVRLGERGLDVTALDMAGRQDVALQVREEGRDGRVESRLVGEHRREWVVVHLDQLTSVLSLLA